MKLRFICILILVFSISDLYSQTYINMNIDSDSTYLSPVEPIVPKNNRIGLQFSELSGYGPCYGRIINNKFAIEIGFLIYGESGSDSTNKTDLFYSLGAALRYTLVDLKPSRIYSFVSYHYLVSKNSFDYSYFEYKRESDYKSAFGFGLGYEPYLSQRVTINMEAGYIIISDKTTRDLISGKTINIDKTIYRYSFGIGLHYAF